MIVFCKILDKFSSPSFRRPFVGPIVKGISSHSETFANETRVHLQLLGQNPYGQLV